MKVTQVAICPSQTSAKSGRPALTPELLAASGARYSRNNEGLDSILSKIDPADLDKSVESIFRMVDYGHQSIADMVPVAMFIDGISLWLAYLIWTLCPTAAGQESSTRYLKLSRDGLIPPEQLGISTGDSPRWQACMENAFRAYQSSMAAWEQLSDKNPDLTGIPSSLLNDSSDAAMKKVARMRRNFAFDRARYFLPVAAATNSMLVMSARGWVNLCQHLLSHALPEPRTLGAMLRSELEIAAPRMVKYAKQSESHQKLLAAEFEKLVGMARKNSSLHSALHSCENRATPALSILLPDGISKEEIAGDLAWHNNRYAPVGSGLQRIGVRFGWSAIAFAEIRDLNRHRTGTKYCPQAPQGFYFAIDQLSASSDEFDRRKSALVEAAKAGISATAISAASLREGHPSYIYWSLLGTEYPFEHMTTADKFIYEAELRTGLGAHFRYAKHLRDALALWYSRFPGTRGLVLEGSAEPE
jgi:thymidylate synthase ThyX